ncbi:MAG: glycosyl transferase, partial [Bryobacteraceae bacterium]
MADFHQTGTITTLHRLNTDGLSTLERDLRLHAEATPIGLVLPALYTEFERPAMRRIVEELRKVSYLSHIVLALGRANETQYLHAKSFFDGFETPVTFLQVDHPQVASLFSLLKEHRLESGTAGKGRTCWLAYGLLLAQKHCEVIALHDCDIKNYRRDLLARLCYPAVHPELGFEFVKGFYARTSDRMHGRVTRLFLAPLLRAMESLSPDKEFLQYLGSFRYALAGEFAMRTRTARGSRIPCDWGLEIGMLSEAYRNSPRNRICQVDLTDNYDHKHQPLSADDSTTGLRKMARDITGTLLRTVAGEGTAFSTEALKMLEIRYARIAEEMIERYNADAIVNGLQFDRHGEETAVAAFQSSLR